MVKLEKSKLYRIVLLCYILVCVVLIENSFRVNLAILRYMISLFAVYNLVIEVKNNRNNYLANKNILLVFYCWIIIMVFRSFTDIFSSFSGYINLKIFVSEEILLYSFPLLMFIDIQIEELKKIFYLALIFGIVYLVISIVFFSYFTTIDIENMNTLFSPEAFIVFFPSSLIIILFTSNYHSKRINYLNIGILLFAIFASVLLARRNKVLYFGTAFLFTGYLINFTKSIIIKQKRFLNTIYSALFISLVVAITVINLDKFALFFERIETGGESREGVIDEFFSDFDSSPQDWIWGRGFHGKFYSKTLSTSDMDNYRDVIENGYLFLILKGGIIYLVLLIIIILLSFYNGFIRSKNLLSKGMALILILYLIDLYGFGLPSIGFKYMILFIAIAICNSVNITKMTDLEILQKIQLK